MTTINDIFPFMLGSFFVGALLSGFIIILLLDSGTPTPTRPPRGKSSELQRGMYPLKGATTAPGIESHMPATYTIVIEEDGVNIPLDVEPHVWRHANELLHANRLDAVSLHVDVTIDPRHMYVTEMHGYAGRRLENEPLKRLDQLDD